MNATGYLRQPNMQCSNNLYKKHSINKWHIWKGTTIFRFQHLG